MLGQADAPAQPIEHQGVIVGAIPLTEGETAIGVDAPVGFGGFPDFFLQGLFGVTGAVADETGPGGAVFTAEEGGVGAGPLHLADALAGERERKGEVVGDGGLAAPGAEEVVDHGADVRPVSGVTGCQFHGDIDGGHAGGGEGDAVDGVLVGDAAEDGHFVRHAG